MSRLCNIYRDRRQELALTSRGIHAPGIQCSVRFGSFVNLRVGSNPTRTVVAQFHSPVGNWDVQRFVIYAPLFPDDSTNSADYPELPEHNIQRIARGEAGWSQTELYRTSRVLDIYDGVADIISPAFVFTQFELGEPANCWHEGIRKVYVVRHEEEERDSGNILKELDLSEHFCFPMKYPGFVHPIRHFVFRERCSLVIWFALQKLHLTMIKLMNRRAGTVEDFNSKFEEIGLFPREAWIYIILMCEKANIYVHDTDVSMSYMKVLGDLSRQKVRYVLPGNILRFRTEKQLQFLRDLLGFGTTYGLTERRPTLRDRFPSTLQNNYTIALIKGAPNDRLEEQFVKKPGYQLVEFKWTPLSFRVTVNFQTWLFHRRLADNSLKWEPPTDHLASVLAGNPYPHVIPRDTVPSDAESDSDASYLDASDVEVVEEQDPDPSVIKVGVYFEWKEDIYVIRKILKDGERVMAHIVDGPNVEEKEDDGAPKRYYVDVNWRFKKLVEIYNRT